MRKPKSKVRLKKVIIFATKPKAAKGAEAISLLKSGSEAHRCGW